MPIEVVHGDGERQQVIEFPDGTPDRDIASVMRRLDQESEARARYTPPRDRTGSNMPRSSNPQGRRPAAQRMRPLPRGYTEAAGGVANLAHGLTIGFNDEMTGAMGGAGDAIAAALGGENVGDAYQGGYRREADRTREYRDQFLQDRWALGNALQGTGAAAPILATGGAAAAPQATGRGLPLLLNQSARGAATGGAVGAVAGAGSSSGNLSERLTAANETAGVGAALGAAAPVAVNAARPVVEAGVNLARRIPTPQPNSVGAFGRPMRPPTSGATPLPRAAAGTVDRLADRAGMNAGDVERSLTTARARGQGHVLADVFDEPGRQTVRAMAQFPGRTGQRAAETARTRLSEQPGRIVGALRRGLRVSETRQDAIRRLVREYDQASAEAYTPIWQQRIGQEQRAALEQRLQPYVDDPVFRDAVQRAKRVFGRDRRNGLVSGEINDNFARYAHYLKLGLDDAAQFSSNPAGGIGATELRGVRDMRARIIAAIDDNVPGYKEARSRWGGIINAEEALDEGAGFLRSSPDQVRARLSEMTDFEKMHARIGLVDEITNNMRGGRVVGARNVANALDYRDTQDIVAAAFDNPGQAAEFLDVLNTSNQLARNALSWNSGSSSIANAAHGADEALNTAADIAGSVATGQPGAVVARGIRGTINAATGRAIERANNVRGDALLTRVDTQDSAEFARAVVDELRRREATRSNASLASRVGAAEGGLAASRNERK